MPPPAEDLFEPLLGKYDGQSFCGRKFQSCGHLSQQRSFSFNFFFNPLACEVPIQSHGAISNTNLQFNSETTSVTQTKLDEVERKATTIRETVDLRAKEHDEAFAVTDRKIDRLSQTTTSQLDLISRCQTQYFPILLQHVKSVSQVPKDIAHNQRKYFLRVFSVLRLTNIKIDELRMIGAQLVVVYVVYVFGK